MLLLKKYTEKALNLELLSGTVNLNALQHKDTGGLRTMWSESNKKLKGERTFPVQNGFSNSVCFSLHQDLPIEREHILGNPKVLIDQRTHPTTEQYACSECNKSYSIKASLLRHVLRHKTPKLHQCTECEKRFRTRRQLMDHQKAHSLKGPWKCNDCEKLFHTKGRLKIHLKSNCQEIEFHCPECDKSFTHKGNFKRHQMMHSGEKPFVCTTCGKSYTRKQYLISHQAVHSENVCFKAKPYHCIKCKKSFTQKRRLIGHQRRHTKAAAVTSGQYQHPKQETNGVECYFTNHQKLHCKKREGQCNACEDTLIQITNHLKDHKASNSEQPDECTECEKSFVKHSHHIFQETRHTDRSTVKTHTIMAKLLEVSVPNEYFIPHLS